MADSKPALVLHLSAGGEPLIFPLTADSSETVQEKLPDLLKHGGVHSLETRDGNTVSVNFVHVAAAYVDDLSRKGKFGLSV
ncbi:hypothetical protein CU254_40445 [Amycolatopsis sp. AA4]|uniref:hypothetical protein n=1 Tax=Actinomycetes TaxID=1760 RepID=UPI0001B54112|nr:MULTISPECIES: hypothetical protein [Actinomycetes]ATY15959.1 hypothetical protein CU254_40445 [Amycolatopsis sp. AA4]EFL12297.1 predicted protein [Streptomyces sp. AA4]